MFVFVFCDGDGDVGSNIGNVWSGVYEDLFVRGERREREDVDYGKEGKDEL